MFEALLIDHYADDHWKDQIRDNLGRWAKDGLPDADSSLLMSHTSAGPTMRHWLRAWAMENLRNKSFLNKATGWTVLVDKGTIKKIASQQTESALAMLVLPKIIAGGLYQGSETPREFHVNQIGYHYLVHPVVIDGSLHAVRLAIRETSSAGHKAYSLHAVQIEKGSPQIPAHRVSGSAREAGEPSPINIDTAWEKIKAGNDYYAVSFEAERELYALGSHAMHAARPTRAQAEAGNFRMGHISLQGLNISIETPKGRRRRPEWPPMAAHYGYIRGTLGRDGDHLDVFVGPDRLSELVFVVDQSGASGKRFDEHKIMLGFGSQADAIEAYRASYRPGWTVGPVTTMTMGQFKAWLCVGDHTKPVHRQVSRYSIDDLAIADDSPACAHMVDRYEWRAEQHPRHEAGSPDGVGGQFAPSAQSSTGNRPGGSLSPRMLASAHEKAWIAPGQPQHMQPVDAYKPAKLDPAVGQALHDAIFAGKGQPASNQPLKSTRRQEIAALPDNVKEGHALHLSALNNRDRYDLMDWSRRLHEAMEKVQGPNEEAEWAKANKNYITALLDEMNARDRAARGRGVRLSDYVNANGMIPEPLAARLKGGRRFFDPEAIRDKLKAGAPSPEKSRQLAEEKEHRTAQLDKFRFGTREERKAILSTPGDLREMIYRAMGLTPGLGHQQPTPETAAEPVKETLTGAEPLKESPENFNPLTPESLFETLSKAHQRKLDEAITGGDSEMPGDQLGDLREHVLQTWREMTDQAKAHNEAIRQIMSGAFAKNGGSWGIISARLAKGEDPSKIKGFDQMVDYAKSNFPHVLTHHRGSADTGSDEEGLVEALRKGLQSMPNPWDREVIDEAQARYAPVMAGGHEDVPHYPTDPDDPDYVPFSVASIVAEIMRYWNEPAEKIRFCA